MSKPDESKNNFDSFDIEFKNPPGLNKNMEHTGDIFVQLEESTSRFIHNYCNSDTSQELAGVLLGHYDEKDGRYYVYVEAAVEAKYTEAKKGSVTFTHKSWEYINDVREKEYPQHKVVGWFHTHPGFGIFLSGYDKFIHQNFFNLPWQVAYVIDPVAGTHGFFGWASNNLINVPFNEEVIPEPQLPKELPVQQAEKKTAPIFKSAAVAAVVLLFMSNAYLFISYQEANKIIEENKAALSGFEQDYNNLQSENKSLVIENENLTEEVEELSALTKDEPVEQAYIVHTIEAGDSLWSISEQHLDDGKLYVVLAELNNIEDPDKLEVGNKLLIPPVEISKE